MISSFMSCIWYMGSTELWVAVAAVSFYVLAYAVSASSPAPEWFVRHVAGVRVMVLLMVACVPLVCLAGGPCWGMLVATVVTLAYADFLAFSDVTDQSSAAGS